MSTGQDVIVGYLNGDYVTQEFHHCERRLMVHDFWGSHRICGFVTEYANVNICRSRNAIVSQFLDHDNAEWLLMLDVDAAFAPTMLDSLLESADPLERPIVGALAHQRRGKHDDDGEPVLDELGNQIIEVVPTMYRVAFGLDGTYEGYQEVTSYSLGLNEVDATGCHCLLVHRNVFEAIKSDHPYRWFREDEWVPGGPVVGEDIWFCLAARDAGFPLFVDTRLEAGHVKRFVVTSAMSHIERIT